MFLFVRFLMRSVKYFWFISRLPFTRNKIVLLWKRVVFQYLTCSKRNTQNKSTVLRCISAWINLRPLLSIAHKQGRRESNIKLNTLMPVAIWTAILHPSMAASPLGLYSDKQRRHVSLCQRSKQSHPLFFAPNLPRTLNKHLRAQKITKFHHALKTECMGCDLK